MRFRGWSERITVAALLGLSLSRSAGGADLRAVLGLERDDNPFEEAGRGHGSWITRFYASTSGRLVNRTRGNLDIGYQGGIKRFWRSDPSASGSRGDVVTSEAAVSGQVRLARSWVLSGGGDAKVKHAERISSEEGYLRGAVEGAATGALGHSLSIRARYRRGGDDSRSVNLPDLSLHETGVEVSGGPSRRLQGRAAITWRWLGYGRAALSLAPIGVEALPFRRQQDRLREVSAGVHGYRGALVQASYHYLSNRSNSFGYGFRGHRVQVMVTRHLVRDVDGQVLLTLQSRRYGDPLQALSEDRSAADEYEQTMAILKLSRPITPRCGISAQFTYTRNGARGGDAFYRKQVWSLSLDASL